MKSLALLLLFLMLSGCSSLPSVGQFFAAIDDSEETAEANSAESLMSEKLSQSNDGIIEIDSSTIKGTAFNSAAVDNPHNQSQNMTSGNIDAFGSMVQRDAASDITAAYKGMPLTKHVGDYVRNMAQDLVSNMEYVSERTPVAVTHFSLIDSDLRVTNLLGQQMAESFVHEFHKFRMPVVEYKATQFIRVTDGGDYVLSRDFLDLKNSTPIEYVLTGTMTKHQGGFIINARMLGMQSNVVVASAQSFIPYYIVDALLPSGSSRQNEIIDGVRIIRGE